jgi:hypothetical protein
VYYIFDFFRELRKNRYFSIKYDKLQENNKKPIFLKNRQNRQKWPKIVKKLKIARNASAVLYCFGMQFSTNF